jgi:SCP-2 sterol transfer family
MRRESEGNTVSNEDAGAMPQTAEQTARQEIAEFFSRVTAGGPQPRLRYVSGTCLFNIAGAGSWRGTIANGVPTVTQDGTDAAPVDCTVECTAEDFLRIVHREGNMNILAAFLQGLVTIKGDISFAAALLGGVTFDTVGAQPR